MCAQGKTVSLTLIPESQEGVQIALPSPHAISRGQHKTKQLRKILPALWPSAFPVGLTNTTLGWAKSSAALDLQFADYGFKGSQPP